jgi:hypothetical protein
MDCTLMHDQSELLHPRGMANGPILLSTVVHGHTAADMHARVVYVDEHLGSEHQCRHQHR